MRATPRPKASPNFAFLTDPSLVRIAAYAELYSHTDPNTTLIKLRQFIERLAELMAAHFALEDSGNLHSLINQLAARGIASPGVAQKMHDIRELGNDAVHKFAEEPAKVLHAIKTTVPSPPGTTAPSPSPASSRRPSRPPSRLEAPATP